MIPYGRQSIDETDIAAVVEVLRSAMLTQGAAVPAFERRVADFVEAAFGVAVNSATSALHVACLALGLGEGDWLWTVPNTFIASANAGLYCGAGIDFIDIDPRTYGMDPAALETKLAAAEALGRLPKIVVPVHFAGQSCDMARIGALGRRYGFGIIEDASHAVGALYQGRPVGCCAHSDVTIFSFHPVKIVTTGEGGMAMTNDPVLARRMSLLRSHGITKDEAEFGRPSDGPWDYRQIALGFNYRLTDIQAALGLAQFARIDGFLARRRAIAAAYDEAIAGLPVLRPWQNPDALSSWHLYIIEVEAKSRRDIFEFMRARGVGVQVLYIPVHRQPYYEALGFRSEDFPVSTAYYERSFTLPIFPAYSDEQQCEVVGILEQALASSGVGERPV